MNAPLNPQQQQLIVSCQGLVRRPGQWSNIRATVKPPIIAKAA